MPPFTHENVLLFNHSILCWSGWTSLDCFRFSGRHLDSMYQKPLKLDKLSSRDSASRNIRKYLQVFENIYLHKNVL